MGQPDNSYYISDDYLTKLLSGLSRIEQEEVKELLKTDYNSSCYGMAVTAILSCYGILEPAQYQDGANYLHDISLPVSDEVKSLINYYNSMQATDEIAQYLLQALYAPEKEKIQTLLEQLKKGSPILLTYVLGNGACHAAVAYDMKNGHFNYNDNDYTVKVQIYDNNTASINDNYCMYINPSKGSWIIPEYESANTADGAMLGFSTNNLNIINYHGYLNETDFSSGEEFIPVLSSKAISNYSLNRRIWKGSARSDVTGDDDGIQKFSSYSSLKASPDIRFAVRDNTLGCKNGFVFRSSFINIYK